MLATAFQSLRAEAFLLRCTSGRSRGWNALGQHVVSAASTPVREVASALGTLVWTILVVFLDSLVRVLIRQLLIVESSNCLQPFIGLDVLGRGASIRLLFVLGKLIMLGVVHLQGAFVTLVFMSSSFVLVTLVFTVRFAFVVFFFMV